MKIKREIWIDNIKAFACALIVCGHFFQSMVSADLMSPSTLYTWFINTIYSFHVPLFFVCSGFLYQKYTCVDNVKSWRKNIEKKIIILGIPYFTFSLITWLLKCCFSGAVNTQNDELLTSLFVNPMSPYWYLYVLFFLFVITPTFQNKRMAVGGVVVAITLKCMDCVGITPNNVYLLQKIMECEIWFVLGMLMHIWEIPKKCYSKPIRKIGMICTIVFLLISSVVSINEITTEFLAFVSGLLGCVATILLLLNTSASRPRMLVKNTMPIYLMHTIFAAGLRAVLLKIGIAALEIHVIFGLGISFVGPIIATMIMERMKLDVLIFPGRYIKIQNG